jgi:hypothetical protein
MATPQGRPRASGTRNEASKLPASALAAAADRSMAPAGRWWHD